MEFIFEFFLELILEPVVDGIMTFAVRIVPEEKISEGWVWVIKLFIGLIMLGAMFSLVIGLIALFGAEQEADRIVGKRLLIFAFITFFVTIIIRIFTPKKNEE